MRIVCQQTILMNYMYLAFFVIFEKKKKTAKFELSSAAYDHRWRFIG